jgi:hypothetical protein
MVVETRTEPEDPEPSNLTSQIHCSNQIMICRREISFPFPGPWSHSCAAAPKLTEYKQILVLEQIVTVERASVLAFNSLSQASTTAGEYFWKQIPIQRISPWLPASAAIDNAAPPINPPSRPTVDQGPSETASLTVLNPHTLKYN